MMLFNTIFLSVDVNECDATPCDADRATCHNTVGSYTCTCKAGYQGNGINCKGEFQIISRRLSYFVVKAQISVFIYVVYLSESPCEEDNTVACKAFSSHVSPFLPSLMCGSKAKSHHCLDDKRNNHLCRFPSASSVYYPLREAQSRDKQLVHSVSLQTDVSL